jgi:hypothetical protein
MRSPLLRATLMFAVVGYLIALGLYFAPVNWHLRSTFVLAICPPAFLTTISMTDPSLATVAIMLAPLNAVLYGIVGIFVGLVARRVGNRKAAPGTSSNMRTMR